MSLHLQKKQSEEMDHQQELFELLEDWWDPKGRRGWVVQLRGKGNFESCVVNLVFQNPYNWSPTWAELRGAGDWQAGCHVCMTPEWPGACTGALSAMEEGISSRQSLLYDSQHLGGVQAIC